MIPVITFFNNKSGVGKTSLVYHLSWMLSEQGTRVVAIDLDPQANLTAAFLDEDQMEQRWEGNEVNTIYRAVQPLARVSDIQEPSLYEASPDLHLLAGDVALSSFEDILSDAWPSSLGDANLYRPFRILTAFWQVMQRVGTKVNAELLLVDVGPNLGAINRSVLIATDFVIIPMGADLFSIQGLKNLGPTLRSWCSLWEKRLTNWKNPDFELPTGKMLPIGYICQQYSVRLNRPVKAYDKWVDRIPATYRRYVLDKSPGTMKPAEDPLCLATLKHFRSLIPLGHEHRKPIFRLTSADGAIGSHATSVQDAYEDFQVLAQKIMARLTWPGTLLSGDKIAT